MQHQLTLPERRTSIDWKIARMMIFLHVGAVAALFHFSWSALAVAIFLWWVSLSLGIGMCYHRLLTHRSYETPKLVEYFLTLCGSLAFQGGNIEWVAAHRLHHTHTDREGDPHSPRDGWWWSHAGWILTGTAQEYPPELLESYAPDLMRDRFHVWLNKYFFVPVLLSALVLFAIGGWSWLLWGAFFRIVCGFHSTWLVNSATHIWGSRRFETSDDSRNNWLIALLTFGEGWHNNHHAQPVAAQHGLKWYEIDLNWWGIRTLELLGLAKSVKRPRLLETVLTTQMDLEGIKS